ncbi:MAG TPA: DMT family transporter [Actinomycetota bacterium]|nr:DMT family transporter [Actinomycetota bacterium]
MTLGVPLGLGSGLCWGTADFFGGVQSRRLPALAVVLWSQTAGALALAVALAVQGTRPTWPGFAWGLAAGAGSGFALLLFYRGLAEGAMSVVAPVAACGAVVPVVVAPLRGELPSAVAGLGIVAAVAGVVLVSRSPDPHQHPGGRPAQVLAMALGAALGFGLFFVFVDAGMATPGAAPLWVVAGARTSSLLVLTGIGLTVGRSKAGWPGRRIGPVALVGIADTSANVLFANAATSGNLAVVGVLGSLYPVATVVLARWLLRERLSASQNAGVLLALTGVGLLATG